MRDVDRYTIMAKLREAHAVIFGGVEAAAEGPYAAALVGKQAPPRYSVEDYANGAVARPTARQGAAEPKGEALAIKNLTERLRDQESRRTDDSELEGIPD
jgi:hypothetical protein